MPKVCETGSCSSACRTNQAPLFLPPTLTVEPISLRSLRDGFAGDAPGEHAGAEEGAFERAAPVDAAAPESCRLTDGVEAGNGGAVRARHAAGEIGLDAAQALAREDELAHGHQRQRL